MISIRNLDPKLVIGFVLGTAALLIMGAAAWNLGALFTFFGRRYVGTGT